MCTPPCYHHQLHTVHKLMRAALANPRYPTPCRSSTLPPHVVSLIRVPHHTPSIATTTTTSGSKPAPNRRAIHRPRSHGASSSTTQPPTLRAPTTAPIVTSSSTSSRDSGDGSSDSGDGSSSSDGGSNSPAPLPAVRFAPTRVRVQHDSHIRASRAAVWVLLQDLTPPRRWPQVAVVLATLEAIYGVEYQGQAQQLLTAYQATTRLAPTGSQQPTTSHSRGSNNGSSSSNGAGDDQQQQQLLQATLLPPAAASAAAPAAAGIEGPASTVSGAAADAVFMHLLLLLASKAGFVGLSERDVQLGISLNTDYLWQLFVKVNTEQLDDQLMAPYLPQQKQHNSAAAASATAAAGDGALHSAVGQIQTASESLLVLRRGYSSEAQRGRWLLQKLDYLQLLLIKRAFGGLGQLGRTVAAAVAGNRGAFGGGAAAAQPQAEAAGGKGGGGARIGSSSSLKGRNSRGVGGESSTRSSSRKAAQGRQPSGTKKQQREVQAAVSAPANGRSSNNNSSSNGRSSTATSSNNKPGGWLQGLLLGGSSRPAGRTDSFGRPYGYKAGSKVAVADAAAETAEAEADTAASELAATAQQQKHLEQQRQQDEQDQQAAVYEQQHEGQQQHEQHGDLDQVIQQQQQQQAEQLEQQPQQQDPQQQLRSRRRSSRQRPSLASRLRSRVEASLCAAAYTLSDWGLIPRLDVTPLERFEAKYPLTESQRLQPLFIEKATLPDILDPLLEARFPWLAGASSSGGSTDQSVSSSSSSSDGDDRVSTSTSSGEGLAAAPQQRGFVRGFLQPVTVVEPTFRQLLVVYRRKPRVDRWRQLRDRLTGRRGDAAPASSKREPIQLQVYRDIPLPSWQVVYPDKLLQFRPLDLLRLDLFGVAGATAALAQAKYNSIVLQLLTLVTLGVWATRLVLGYLRMDDRYKSIVAQLLADRTVASGEGGLEYLATAAGLQQFKQTALAYVLLLGAAADAAADAGPDSGLMGEQEVAVAAEGVLQQRLQLQLRFNAAEALSELRRFGLLVERSQRAAAATAAPTHAGAAVAAANGGVTAAASSTGTGSSDEMQHHHQQQDAPSSSEHAALLYSVLGSARSTKVLQQFWAGLLRDRVGSILRDTGSSTDGRLVLAEDEDDITFDHLT